MRPLLHKNGVAKSNVAGAPAYDLEHCDRIMKIEDKGYYSCAQW